MKAYFLLSKLAKIESYIYRITIRISSIQCNTDRCLQNYNDGKASAVKERSIYGWQCASGTIFIRMHTAILLARKSFQSNSSRRLTELVSKYISNKFLFMTLIDSQNIFPANSVRTSKSDRHTSEIKIKFTILYLLNHLHLITDNEPNGCLQNGAVATASNTIPN